MNEELKVIISANADKLKKGCQEASKALGDVGESAESAGKKTDGAFAKIGNVAKSAGGAIAKGTTAAIAAAAAGVATLATAAIKSYAEYEQLVGGVETLFKDSADKVQQYASEAYKTAGLSANEYMSTVTSFSASLLQSLGGDTAKASEYANQAIIDMSDNANKMGTSMESIQNAYQGFAKQNYTMLDNLKLGYGGTKEEMIRLVQDAAKVNSAIDANSLSFGNIVQAIHTVQNEMGITGTTSKEAASTISGSVGMMKASWENLITGIADDNADFDKLINEFVESVTTMGDNILPRIEVALNGVADLISKLLPKIAEKLPTIVNNILPSLLAAAINVAQTLITGVADILPSLLDTVVSAVPTLIQAYITAWSALVEALPQVIETIVSALPTLLPQLINGIVTMVITLAANIMNIIQPIIDMLPTLIQSIAEALIANLPLLIEGVLNLVIALVAALPDILTAIIECVLELQAGIAEAILRSLPALLLGIGKLIVEIAKQLPELLLVLLRVALLSFEQLWIGIKTVFSVVDEWFGGIFSKAWEKIKEIFKPVAEWFGSVWQSIKNVFNLVGKWYGEKFREAFNKVKEVFSPLINFFSGIWNKIKSIFTSVGKAIGSAISNAVKGAINSVLSFAVNNINKFISAINTAISIINAIPGVEIKKIGKLSVPKFAEGGIVDSATLAVIGERGKEAVVPLENNTEWLDMLEARLNRNNSGNTPIILQVDGKTFAQTTINTLNDYTRQTGSLPLKLA